MKLNKRPGDFLLFIAVLFLGLVLVVCRNERTKSYSVGVMNVVPVLDETFAGFKEGMKERGYREGENIRYHYYGPTKEMSRLQEIARKLLTADVDLILTITTPATLAAKKATAGTGLPVVFAIVTDPLGVGIVKSIRHPGGDVTGIAFGLQEERRLEWLIRIAPKTRRIYIPYNPNDKSPVLALKTVRKAALKLGVKLLTREVSNQKTLNHAVSHIPHEADAVFLLPDSFMATRLTDMVATAIRYKRPVSAANISTVKVNNVLISYGFDRKMVGKQAARLAHQIFNGTKPADIPVEIAEFYLAVNLKVAKKIGLIIPDKILRHAHYIIR